MGSWGTGVFTNDTGADLADDFKQLVAGGRSATEATEQLVEEYGVGPGGADDHDFWLGLASVQHRTGHVVPDVIDRARRIIEDPAELERWSASDRRARSRVLTRLGERAREATAEPADGPPPPTPAQPAPRAPAGGDPGGARRRGAGLPVRQPRPGRRARAAGVTSRRTPQHPWLTSYAIPWSDLDRFLVDSRTAGRLDRDG